MTRIKKIKLGKVDSCSTLANLFCAPYPIRAGTHQTATGLAVSQEGTAWIAKAGRFVCFCYIQILPAPMWMPESQTCRLPFNLEPCHGNLNEGLKNLKKLSEYGTANRASITVRRHVGHRCVQSSPSRSPPASCFAPRLEVGHSWLP